VDNTLNKTASWQFALRVPQNLPVSPRSAGCYPFEMTRQSNLANPLPISVTGGGVEMRYLPLVVLIAVMMPLAVIGSSAPSQATEGWSQEWTGTLVDAECKTATPAQACAVNDHTKSFGVVTSDNKFFRFDPASSSKIHAALKLHGKSGNVQVTARGYLVRGFIAADAVDVS
jgi:hypothetical protein